jgi:hypothetical protein
MRGDDPPPTPRRFGRVRSVESWSWTSSRRFGLVPGVESWGAARSVRAALTATGVQRGESRRHHRRMEMGNVTQLT